MTITTPKDIIPPIKYHEASIRFREAWLEYLDKEGLVKYEIVNMVKILEVEGYNRTKAIQKIVDDHKDLRGFSRATIYRELPDEMKNHSLGKPNISFEILGQPNNTTEHVNYDYEDENEETTKTLPTDYQVKEAETLNDRD
ncbi:MAG: hypothetical protein ACR2F1_15650 [Nitrososphaeraceae archaeon]